MKLSALWISLGLVACGSKNEHNRQAEDNRQPTVDTRISEPPVDAYLAEPPVDAHFAELAEQRQHATHAAHRAKVAEVLRAILTSTNTNTKLTVTDDALTIDTPDGGCNGRMLIQFRDGLRRRIKIDSSDGFDKMNCGEMGDEIDLHSKDGCPPNQSDMLILTEAGARRDKYTEGMSNLANRMRSNGPALMLLAMGCDATVLSVMSVGGDMNCNEDKLQTLLGSVRGQLSTLGFTQVRCGLDGPSIPVR